MWTLSLPGTQKTEALTVNPNIYRRATTAISGLEIFILQKCKKLILIYSPLRAILFSSKNRYTVFILLPECFCCRFWCPLVIFKKIVFSYYRSKIQTPLFWQFSPFQVPTYLVCLFKRNLPINPIAIKLQFLMSFGWIWSFIIQYRRVRIDIVFFSQGCESTQTRLRTIIWNYKN
jgi:hypothetical protein